MKFNAIAAAAFCFCLASINAAWAAEHEAKTPYYTLAVAPLKLVGAEAAPARVFLLG